MIQFCQTTCRTRYILEHFGEEVTPDWSCDNCDACDANVELMVVARNSNAGIGGLHY